MENYNLYLAKTIQIPKDENGEEFQVIYIVDSKKEISPEIEENLNLQYAFIVLQKTQKEIDSANEIVINEWKNLSDLPIELELITDNLENITREFRKLVINVDVETVIFKTQVVGFDELSECEKNGARKLLLDVSTKSKWNFWS